MSDAALSATLDDWLAPWLTGMSRRDHLARLDMTAIVAALLDWNQRQRLDELAPTHLQVPSGSRIPIDYSAAPTRRRAAAGSVRPRTQRPQSAAAACR